MSLLQIIEIELGGYC